MAVAAVPGASYAWSIDGGTITGNANSDQITIALGTKATATASVTITAGSCTSHGSGVIALHDPFAVRTSIPEGGMGTPLTIQWNYEGGSPARQSISGSDLPRSAHASRRRAQLHLHAGHQRHQADRHRRDRADAA